MTTLGKKLEFLNSLKKCLLKVVVQTLLAATPKLKVEIVFFWQVACFCMNLSDLSASKPFFCFFLVSVCWFSRCKSSTSQCSVSLSSDHIMVVNLHVPAFIFSSFCFLLVMFIRFIQQNLNLLADYGFHWIFPFHHALTGHLPLLPIRREPFISNNWLSILALLP